VRHVRILALCLTAMFALSATTLVVASPAFANKETKEQEKREKKEKEKDETAFAAVKHCPYQNLQVEFCFAGITTGGQQGGFYQIGKVKVPLSKPVELQGGLYEKEGAYFIVPAANGGETLESPALPVPGGLKLISPEEIGYWPAEVKQAYKEALKNKESALFAKIEVGGGNLLYEIPNALDTNNLVFEHGAAFTLPLKVKITGPWLEKLGGGPCTVGNETTPVMQYLTTEPSSDGTSGKGEFFDEGNIVTLKGSRLGDFGWNVSEGALAKGCGGPYESYIDEGLNATLGIPADHGVTILQGNLWEAFATTTRAYFEG
jgi:hypothetical protein